MKFLPPTSQEVLIGFRSLSSERSSRSTALQCRVPCFLRAQRKSIIVRHDEIRSVRPINSHLTTRDEPMNRRMRPIARTRDKPMFYWIEMNVIDVGLQITLVADCVFPKSGLPQVFALRAVIVFNQRVGKPRFNQFPTYRKIMIACGERPHDVQMFRHDHMCDGFERMRLARIAKRRTQMFDVIRERCFAPIRKCNGEEIGSAFDVISSVSDHEE
jgi:hypothetical protein